MIKIVTDTGVSLPAEIIERHGIGLSLGYVVFGKEILRDNMDSAAFYARLATTSTPTRTLDSTVDDVLVAYRHALKDAPDSPVIAIHVSSKLSTTLEQSRKAAASFPDNHIRIFDSMNVSLGQGLMVHAAARMAEEGLAVGQVMDHLKAMRDRTQLYFTLDTIKYLVMGGRAKRVDGFLSQTFALKPMLRLESGDAVNHSLHLSRRRAVDAVRQIALDALRGKTHIQMGVLHAACEDEARRLADALRETLRPDVFLFSDLMPSVGAHAGPGALGVAWYAPE